MDNRAQKIFKPEFRFGLGGVPLGNEFAKHTDKDARATLEAAWALGVRYYDVAPWYGLGLAERRFGNFLHGQRRDNYLLSSKVGKLFKASKNNHHAEMFPLSDSPNDLVIDYTADGVRRSIEDSLQRLGVSHLDVAFVHDLSPDFKDSSWAIPRRIRSFTFDITPLETGWRRKSQASSPHAQFPQADSIRLGQAATYRHRHESARGSPGISPASVTLSRSHCRLARLPGMTSPGVVPILN